MNCHILKTKFVRDVAALEIGNVVFIIANFITSIAIARSLHPENYGLYALVFGLYGIISILGDIGITRATVTELSEAYANKDQEKTTNLLTSYLKISLIMAFLLLIAGWFLAPYLAAVLYNKPQIGNLVRPLFLIGLLGIPYNLVTMALQSIRMMKELAILENSFWIIRASLVIFALLSGMGIAGIIYASVTATLFFSLIAVISYKRLRLNVNNHLPPLIEIVNKVRGASIKWRLKFSFLITIDRNITRLYTVLPILILGKFAPLSQVGFFKLAFVLVSQGLAFINPIYRNLDARLPARKTQDSIEKMKSDFKRVLIFSGLISAIIAVIIAAAAPCILIHFYGREYIPALNIVYLLLIYLMVLGSGSIALHSLCQAFGKIHLAITAKLAILILFMPLGLLLIKHKAALGAAVFLDILFLFSAVTIAFLIFLAIKNKAFAFRKESLRI